MNLEDFPEEDELQTGEERVHTWQNRRVVSRYRLRRLQNMVAAILVIACVAVILYPLLDILFMFTYQGVLSISIPKLIQTTQNGGIANALLGTLLLAIESSMIAIPIGVLGGIYLAEFSGRAKLGDTVRFVADVLAGIPSILLGYLSFFVLILYFHWGMGIAAGSITLAILMLPYILRTTEISLRKVPQSLREAAIALGSTKTQMINRMTFSLALPGIVTGIVLSLSIAIGEFAPLWFTVGNSDKFVSCLTTCPSSYLTYILWLRIISPNTLDPSFAYTSALLLVLLVVGLNVVARVGLRRISRV